MIADLDPAPGRPTVGLLGPNGPILEPGPGASSSMANRGEVHVERGSRVGSGRYDGGARPAAWHCLPPPVVTAPARARSVTWP
jgi:hypothetical protein